MFRRMRLYFPVGLTDNKSVIEKLVMKISKSWATSNNTKI